MSEAEEALLHAPLWLGLLCGGPYDGQVVRMYSPVRPRNILRYADGTRGVTSSPPEVLASSPECAIYLAGEGSEYWYLDRVRGER